MDNIVVPKGISAEMQVDFLKGDKGEKGDTGEQGVPGADGYSPVKGVDYFTQEDIDGIVSSILDDINLINFLVVDALPAENIDSKTIYFVKRLNESENVVYDEFLFFDGDWRLIGSTEMDFSGSCSKDELNTMLERYLLKTELEDRLNGFYDKSAINSKLETSFATLELDAFPMGGIPNGYTITLPLMYIVR